MVSTRARACWTVASALSLLAILWVDPLLGTLPCCSAEEPTKAREVTVRGKVVSLANALKSAAPDLKADSELTASQVVLVSRDGAIIPLVPDEASKALFLEPRLRDRPVELRGRLHPSLPHLQVITLKVEEDGKLRTPEYFCHVCAISLRYPQTCPCCQGPMEFRMKPEHP